MREELIAVFGAMIISPLAIASTIIYLRRFTNQERMKLIETGGDPSLLLNKQSSGKFTTLRFALLLIGIGTGFLMGRILDKTMDMEEVGYFSMLFICGGAGLIIAYFMENKKEKEGEKKQS